MPILSFLRRYWLGLLMLLLAVLVTRNDALFQQIGTLLYIPAAVAVAGVTAYFLRHLAFPRTIDLEAHNGQFVHEWRNYLDPKTRVILTVVVTVGIFLGVAIIVAGVAR